ncbi:nucleoside triphosphate hydrolase [Agrobacterium tumefaciens]|uniref:Putative fructose transport system kinase n=1 Tax=Agrobacterium tumefaciens str. Kerr 14 TaxID=1183424 RepID=A0A1S7RET6_AGRTU|nr:nucleoside triphosphate hydrolase [Agrobacterium tumefaciens]AYM84766.1 nucleoside triphosphate hydrolase [Agrobacterium tumefaciens]MCW8059616.1 nucleoside triphosphate hydrolase [Agrobacterium tumefaciens]MCW8146071.1 nucleoside triphosphate hydrolase [Agrobacterium tumefaciens]NTE94976.1 nucleoside triphosphate hydrolase [Agrobacterium tumefaciens]CUX51453.1 putative fructose transport system kinase [Agrobacterium tumefaciens str. Kerr 14]
MSKIDDNAREIAGLTLKRLAGAKGRRVMIAIAGAPGSGKSTIAEHVVDVLNADEGVSAALFPMDGFHYDDAVLEEMKRRPFKGAIDTFDAHGLRHMLERLKANEDDKVAVPVFDRAIEIARAGGRLIPQSVDIIVCEGNYLLASQSPWDRLKQIFDLTVFVDVDEDDLRARLRDRWRSFGLGEDEINRKVEENDLPNGRFIISASTEPDLRIGNPGSKLTS